MEKRKRKTFTRPDKGFIEPFSAEPDYYKTKTYEEVFKAIREDIEKNNYIFLYSAQDLNRPSLPEEVVKAIRENVDSGNIEKNNHRLQFVYSAEEGLKYPLPPEEFDDPEKLTKLLKSLVPVCPDLFESDNSSARKLVAHFGRLLNTALHAQRSKETKKPL